MNTSRTILVVHDDPAHADFLSLVLEQSGFTPAIAVDAADGLEKARQYGPDVIVCGLMLPPVNGMALCRAVRADEGLRQTPVLLVTARRQGSDGVVEGLNAGADDVLELPYDPIRFIAKVRRLVERGDVEREPRLARNVTERKALCETLAQAREEERTRIARELHDELGSMLTRVRWDLEALDKEVTAAAPETGLAVHDRFLETARLVDSTIESMQRIAAELRPPILDDLGLVAALESQVQQYQRATGITCRLDVLVNDDCHGPTREQAMALFRIVQEALTNVTRHARASLVNIIVEERAGHLSLEVRDNGVGIDSGAIAKPGALGVLGMRERAALVGGHLDITGRPGSGTVLAVRIPVESTPRRRPDH